MVKDKIEIYRLLFFHSKLSIFRSSFFLKKVASTILILTSFTYCVAILIFVTLNLDSIIGLFNGNLEIDQAIKLYFMPFIQVNLILHLIFSKISSYNIKPYLIQKINKIYLVSYIIMFSKLNVVNFIFSVIIGIITIKFMWNIHYHALFFLIVNANLMFLINNSISISAKILFEGNYFIKLFIISLLIIIAFGLILYCIEYKNISSMFFKFIFNNGLSVFVFLFVIAGIGNYINKRILIKKLKNYYGNN